MNYIQCYRLEKSERNTSELVQENNVKQILVNQFSETDLAGWPQLLLWKYYFLSHSKMGYLNVKYANSDWES